MKGNGPMNRKTFVRVAFSFVASLGLTCFVSASETKTKATVISIPGLHCDGCGKKVAAKVMEIRGVESVFASMQTKTVNVTPKAGASLSPKALWEAVEKANKTPTKLEGPNGTFTSKPTK